MGELLEANLKQIIINHVEQNADKYIDVSQKIHSNPEVGNKEVFASSTLKELLEYEGFKIKSNIAGHDTGFIAKKSSSLPGPTIYFLAEYDALPGLGHACGHNIIGTTSIAAVIALSQTLESTGGTVIVAGTPAEEGGDNGSAKGSFAKAGYFSDGDVALMIHPSDTTRVSGKSLAVDPVDYIFHGKSAHAAAAPTEGINALDSVLYLFNGINALRQHLSDDVRIHGIIPDGGDAPNIVPDYSRARFFIRAANRQTLNTVRSKIDIIANSAANMTGAQLEISEFQNEIDDLLPNKKLNETFVSVFEELGVEVNQSIREGKGSTDTGNVSQVIPTIHPYIKIGENLVGHTPEFREAAKSEEGNAALILGAKGLALIGLNLFLNESLLREVQQEFKELTLATVE